VVILWIVNFTAFADDWPPSGVVAISFSVVALSVSVNLQDYETKRTFLKLRDSCISSFGPFANSNFEEDIVSITQSLDSSLEQQYRLLSAEGLVVQQREGLDFADEDLSRPAFRLVESRLLCAALFLAAAQATGGCAVQDACCCDFEFDKACQDVFAAYEGIAGSALSLFVTKSDRDMIATAPKAFFELVLFLLVNEAARGGICSVTCENVGDVQWRVRIQICTLMDSDQDQVTRTPKSSAKADRTNNASNGEDPNGDESSINLFQQAPLTRSAGYLNLYRDNCPSPSPGSHAYAPSAVQASPVKATPGHNYPNPNPASAISSSERLLETTRHFRSAVKGESLVLDEYLFSNSSAFDRLADRIASKHLNSRIEVSNPEYQAGLKIVSKAVYLPDSGIFTLHPRSLRASLAAGGVMQVEQQWVFVLQRANDMEGLGDVADKLKLLGIPTASCPLNRLSSLPWKSSVGVIYEAHLSQVCGDSNNALIREFCHSLVVLHDSDLPLKTRLGSRIRTETDMTALYGLPVVACLHHKVSMHELFERIQTVTKQLPTRKVDIENGLFSAALSSGNVEREANGLGQFVSGETRGGGGKPTSEKTHHVSVQTWLVLVKRFASQASAFHKHSIVLNILDERLNQIRNLKVETGRPAGVYPAGYYEGVFRDMGEAKRRAKFVTEQFLPVVAELKTLFARNDFAAIQDRTGQCICSSSSLKLARLSCWFATLQESIDILAILVEKDALHGLDNDSKRHKSSTSSSSDPTEVEQLLLSTHTSCDSSAALFEDGIQAMDNFSGASTSEGTALFQRRHSSKSSRNAKNNLQSPRTSYLKLRNIILDMIDSVEVSVWEAAIDR